MASELPEIADYFDVCPSTEIQHSTCQFRDIANADMW